MDIYFILIFVILIIPLLFSVVKKKKRRDNWILLASIVAVYLLMALKAPSVGRDIAGYKRVYEAIQYQSWSNYDITWMEWGYEFLMMVFTHVFHASFQTFMACVYAFVYFSYFVFFKRYSEDYTTSVMLYICFTFLTFDMSAVRTVIGVAICLFAVPYAEKRGFVNLLKFVLITIAAAQIHRSAYIFLAVYFVIRTRFTAATSILYIGVPAVLFLFKNQFYRLINLYITSVRESTMSLGGNLMVYAASILLTVFVRTYYKNSRQNSDSAEWAEDEQPSGIANYFENSDLAMRMIYVGIVLQLFASGTVLTRMAQYVQVFILVLIPDNIARLDRKSRVIVKMVLYALAILYFARYSLFANALDIVPYRFFWSEV